MESKLLLPIVNIQKYQLNETDIINFCNKNYF